jgi:hypothetical protein
VNEDGKHEGKYIYSTHLFADKLIVVFRYRIINNRYHTKEKNAHIITIANALRLSIMNSLFSRLSVKVILVNLSLLQYFYPIHRHDDFVTLLLAC